jgi:hypothetical protein
VTNTPDISPAQPDQLSIEAVHTVLAVADKNDHRRRTPSLVMYIRSIAILRRARGVCEFAPQEVENCERRGAAGGGFLAAVFNQIVVCPTWSPFNRCVGRPK